MDFYLNCFISFLSEHAPTLTVKFLLSLARVVPPFLVNLIFLIF